MPLFSVSDQLRTEFRNTRLNSVLIMACVASFGIGKYRFNSRTEKFARAKPPRSDLLQGLFDASDFSFFDDDVHKALVAHKLVNHFHAIVTRGE